MTEPEFDDVSDPSKLFDHVPDLYSIEDEKQRKAALPKYKSGQQKTNDDQKELEL